MLYEQLTYVTIAGIYEVANKLGAGLFERVYERALAKELTDRGLVVQCQLPISVVYKGCDLGLGFRMDLLVEDRIIIEIKSIQAISAVHKKQLLTYLKLSDKKLGFLVNFNSSSTQHGQSLFRLINDDKYGRGDSKQMS